MLRKWIVACMAAMLLLALAGCAGEEEKQAETKAEEPEVITISYANFPPASTFPCVQMERWADEIEERTGGRVKVETYPGGTLLSAKNMYRGVLEGQADIGCLSLAYYPGVFPALLSVNLPVGFTNATVASLTLWDLYEKLQPKEMENLKVVTMFTSAPSNIMSKVAIKSLDDLNGVELRASGALLKMLEQMGAKPVGMPMSQTPEALQKGVVKGLVSSLEVLKDFNFAELCRYETITNLPVYPFAVVMNKDRWNSLPDEVKKVINDLGREQAEWTGRYMDGHIQESLAWSREKYQIEVYELDQADKDRIAEIGEGIIADWKAKADEAGLDADAIYRDMMALKGKYESQYPN
ncbi:TRAP transporter substrate-binding protein [Salidesulfovibrio brasiliensis]